MIGKQDWHEMAHQVHNLEKKMQSTYEQLADNVSDPGLKEMFTRLSQDEQQHAKAINAVSSKMMDS